MWRRVVSYVGRHHWGILATFMALGGTAYASGVLPPSSVGTAQLRNSAVTLPKIASSAQRALRTPQQPTEIPAKLAFESFGHGFGIVWLNVGYGVAAFYRDDQGTVHLSGIVGSHDSPMNNQNQCAIGGGHGSPGEPLLPNIFVLPPGYRPASREIFAVDSGNAHGRVDVTPDGQVICVDGAGDQYVSLDGITFRAR